MTLPIGTLVRIKPNLRSGHNYDIYVSSQMEGYRGKVYPIKDTGSGDYILDIPNQTQPWWWSRDTFDVVCDEETLFQQLVQGKITDKEYEKLIKEGVKP